MTLKACQAVGEDQESVRRAAGTRCADDDDDDDDAGRVGELDEWGDLLKVRALDFRWMSNMLYILNDLASLLNP